MNGTRKCSKRACEEQSDSRGMCRVHYNQWLYRTPLKDRPRPTVDERFDAKVDVRGPSDCWPWLAGATSCGYGRFNVRANKRTIASRFALARAVGEPSDPSMLACHTCDNPPCCNPAHLYWGSSVNNSQDAVSRGRKARGEKSGRAKLSEESVVAIRAAVASGQRVIDIAHQYQVSAPAVSAIIARRSWAHIS